MAMDKDVQNAMIGGGVAAFVSAGLQKYGDPVFAPMLYSATQYAKDLKTTGYVPLAADAGLTDDQIGVKILETTGFPWGSVETGKVAALVGPGHLTATKDTYMAAVGQKVPPYMLPSTMGAGVIGLAAAADAAGKYVEGLSKYRVLEGALGGNLIGYTVARGTGFIGFKAYPSGLDPIALPTGTTQYLDQSAMQNLKRLTTDNSNLRAEIAQLRAATTATAQYPRGMPPGIPSYAVSTQQPTIQVTEIIPGKGAEAIKERTHMVGGHLQKATAESVRHQTGLVTLHGGR